MDAEFVRRLVGLLITLISIGIIKGTKEKRGFWLFATGFLVTLA